MFIFDWILATLDLGSAFLTGERALRQLYVYPPRGGLPGVAVGSLIELCKGVFGLREAPRLWWLKFEATIQKAGFVPIKGLKGVFVLRSSSGKPCGLLVVHVDDGIGCGAVPVFAKAKEFVRKSLNVKKEKSGDFDFLGKHFVQDAEGNVVIDQRAYVLGIQRMHLDARRRPEPSSVATAEEKTLFKSLVQQLAWPARSSMPELCYDVSDLQQHGEAPTVEHMILANKVLEKAQQLARNHHEVRYLRSSLKGDLTVIGVHDASFARQPGGGSQQGFLVAVGMMPSTHKGRAVLVDWGYHKIRRVVKSTLAAEAAAAAHAFDRMVMVQYLLSAMLYGEGDLWLNGAARLRGVFGHRL